MNKRVKGHEKHKKSKEAPTRKTSGKTMTQKTQRKHQENIPQKAARQGFTLRGNL